MNKQAGFFLLIIFTLIVCNTDAQSTMRLREQADSFSTGTKGKTWTISKYLLDSGRLDKKSLFDNIGLQFNQSDSTKFQIAIAGQNAFFGQWTVQNNNSILFSMPYVIDLSTGDRDTTNPYNQAVRMLCSWPLRKVEFQSSLLKFKLMDPFKGEAIIEFSEKIL